MPHPALLWIRLSKLGYLGLIQRLISDVQDLVKDLVDVGVVGWRGILVGTAVGWAVMSIGGSGLWRGLLLGPGVHSGITHGRLVGGAAQRVHLERLRRVAVEVTVS